MQEIKDSYKLKWWPSPQDYNEAVQNPRINFSDPALMAASVHSDKLGLPKPITGAFASVYRLAIPERDVALRCFLRNIDDQQQRYAAISDFVQNDTLSYTVGFDFLKQGVKVNREWFPALKMDWVGGSTLDSFVRVSEQAFRFLKKWDKVTVVFDPKRPTTSLLYKHCFFKAVGP